MWWTPVTPCTGLYIPVFAEGGKLPDVLTRAGGQGKTVTAPDRVKPDTFSETSYWWQFRDLLDRVKGDETGTRFRQRQPVVRKTFDRLERRWLEQSATIQRTAIARRKSGSQADATRGLDAFTDSCVATALETTEMLKREMKV
jgi:secernin